MQLKSFINLILIVFVISIPIQSIALEAETKTFNTINAALTEYKDFPKAGITFYDVSGILSNPKAFKAVIDNLVTHYKNQKVEAILAIDARGFLFATPLAYQLKIPVVMVRKPGKLPGNKIRTEYTKEYGTDVLEMQNNALHAGQRVIIIDDLIATGGTFKAAIDLARQAKANVVEVVAIVELEEFKNTRGLDVNVYSVIKK